MTDSQSEPESFSSRAMSGGRWGALRSLAVQGATILTTAVLARLLSQEEFGLVAIAVIVVTMFDLITRFGFGSSVIRRQELSPRSTSTMFWASAGLGLLATLLAIAVAEPAANLAGSFAAAPLISVAAWTLLLNLSGRIPLALLNRELRFRAAAFIDIVGSFVHGVVAISLAFGGLGAWAVVIGHVCRSASILVGALLVSGFRPQPVFDPRILAEDFRYSGGLLGAEVVGYLNKNTDYWFVGNRLGAGPLGVYYLAYVLPTLLRQRITAIGHEVLFPIAARLQHDADRTAAALLRVVRLISFLVLPTMAGLAVVADLAVLIGFGVGWEDAVVPLRIIAVSAAVTSMTVAANPIFGARGRPGVLVSTRLASLAALAVGLAFSVSGGTLTKVALAVLGAAIVEALILQSRVKGMLGIRHREFLKAVTPFLIGTLVMAGIVWAARLLLAPFLPAVALVLLLIVVGGLAYMGLGLLLFQKEFRAQLTSVRGMAWR